MACGNDPGTPIAALEEELSKLSAEHEALLESARAILTHQDFETSAREIFHLCKKITAATSGYVALLSDDGSENEIVFLDSGGLECSVDEKLPMPIRGLRASAYDLRRAVYDNSFEDTGWADLLPPGHMRLETVLFAPLVVEGEAAGLIGLANKPGGFTQRDVDFVSSLGDIAAVALRNSWNLEQIQYLSFHDHLTGLYNRRYFVNELQRLEGSCEWPIAFVAADVDGLKRINDTHGHAMGDHYLKTFARVASDTLREHDVLARMGGDEFALILPRTDAREAEKVVGRIRRAMDFFNGDSPDLPLRVSLGWMVNEDGGESLEKTYHAADRQMYCDKKKGRVGE